MMEIYAPTGNTGEPQRLTRFPYSCIEWVVTNFDNTKPNARVLLDHLADRLTERVGLTLALAEVKILLFCP